MMVIMLISLLSQSFSTDIDFFVFTGLTLNQSSIEAKLSNQSTQQNRSLQSRKSLFSRHLIGSAPEVKNITSRHFNNMGGAG